VTDYSTLLSTLAESAAAIVAIVGGFLVSRLVQLSSEREGLRRQLRQSRDELSHTDAVYTVAHDYRLGNSEEAFFGWVIDDLVRSDLVSLDASTLLDEHIPRGSTREEMSEYLDLLIDRVAAAKSNVGALLQPTDDDGLEMEDLRDRGLGFEDSEEEIYIALLAFVVESLPRRTRGFGQFAMNGLSFPHIVSPAIQSTELRRLDESIREEQELQSRRALLRSNVERLKAEMERIGHPNGVTPAIVILGIYSLFGILAPVAALAIAPNSLATWVVWSLIGLFAVGLFAVLFYIFWYARSLNTPEPGRPLAYLPEPGPQRGRHQRCLFGRRGMPAHDRPGEAIDDERDINEPAPRSHIREVRDPSPVRGSRGEVPVEEVGSAIGMLVWDRGANPATSNQPVHALQPHQPVDLPGAGPVALPTQPRRHLPTPIQRFRFRVSRSQRVDDGRISDVAS
jgi:hypothetical protein